VLTAIGLSDDWALGSLRVTLGSDNKSADIQAFIQVLPKLVAQVRQLGA
jgi:cysteine sulfinate desulfinase/cysteine desulfurase-like protein